jgi:hypothetical protein
METRESLLCCHERERLSARLNRSLHESKMPVATGTMQARYSGFVCLEKERLSACLYESLYNVEIPKISSGLES